LILVTGAGGFLGGHLLQDPDLRNVPVRALYHSRKPEYFSAANVKWQKCDLLDICQVEEAMEGVTKIFHCAAIVSVDPRKKRALVQNNVAVTANVVNAALE